MRAREGFLFYLFLLVFFLSLGALSLVLLSGERKRGELLAEYEADKLATALLENLRDSRTLDLSQLRGRVLGFGVYSSSGQPLQRFGTAPQVLADPQSPGVRQRRGSFVLVRLIGQPPMMMGRMWGAPRGQPRGNPAPGPGAGFGMGRDMQRMMNQAAAPRVLFLELAAGPYLARQRVFRLAQFVVPLALAGIGALVAAQYRRNSEYRRKLAAQTELARLGEISRTLSHEIKNPLSAIRLQTGLLKKTLPEERRGDLRIIEEEIQRLALLTERVGDFVRDPRGEPRELDLDAFLRELALRYDGRLRYRPLEGEAVRVRVDPQRLRSVLENLINNALESGEGEVEVRCAAQRHRAEVSVLDRGAGIPPGIRDKVFDPFFTSKTKGSGIGLSVARRFVEAAGGQLELADRAGGGTVARVLLPRGGS
jgi:two-component system sensor histidine kinase HydH